MPTPEQVIAQLRESCTRTQLQNIKESVQLVLRAIDNAEQAHKPARIFEIAEELGNR